MKRALLIIAAVLPVATLGIVISRVFPGAEIWYFVSVLILSEIAIRLTSRRLGGVQHWSVEAIWIPYHAFIIYLLGRIIGLSQPTIFYFAIILPLFGIAIVAATSSKQR